MREDIPGNKAALGALAAFCGATILLIPMEWFVPGAALWLASAALAWVSGDAAVRRSLGLLLGCVAVLAAAPIHTELDTAHFFTLGLPFLAVVLVPYALSRWLPGPPIRFRFWPRRWSWQEVGYTLISIPLAWAVIRIYLFHLNPELPTHWPVGVGEVGDATDAARRLTVGINLVGIWDELFFINTSYVLLRFAFPARLANPAQAVLYTSVLYDMAFTGHGAWIVYGFALIQGIMYERSGVLLYVLLVHLIVDVFLVLAILQYHYPGGVPGAFF